MTTITAKVILASKHPCGGKPLYTLQLRYPLIIHAEFMTHRVFSRNSASNRAIPVRKLIEEVVSDPFIPLEWGKNIAGMSAIEEVDDTESCKRAWLHARDNAVESATRLVGLGLHKQVVNRIIMPFQHINTIVTATEWDNFFSLRLQPDVEPHMRRLALAIEKAINEAEYCKNTGYSWHTPYVTNEESFSLQRTTTNNISAARCARVSYNTHDNQTPNQSDDIYLANKLKLSGHLTPFEHQARWGEPDEYYSNFKGWISARHEKEHFDYPEREI